MTAQSAVKMAQVRPINVVNTMHFKTIRPILRSEIPVSRGRGKATMRDLQVFKEFNQLLDNVCEKGLNPYEIAAEIDITSPEVVAEKDKRKSFAQTFRKLLRQSVKDHNLSKQVEVMETNKGERFFVVGRAA